MLDDGDADGTIQTGRVEEARDKRRAQVAEGEKGMKSRGQLACDLRREGETDRVRADWSAVQICWWEDTRR